jgi:hypothetical protein
VGGRGGSFSRNSHCIFDYYSRWIVLRDGHYFGDAQKDKKRPLELVSFSASGNNEPQLCHLALRTFQINNAVKETSYPIVIAGNGGYALNILLSKINAITLAGKQKNVTVVDKFIKQYKKDINDLLNPNDKWGMLKNKQIMVVGLHEDGQPQILERRSIRDINPELFMRDFTAHFLNYTALTCEENLQYAARFFSDGFRSSWNSRFGGIQDFAKTIRDEDVVQVVSVDRVEIVGMDKRGLEAKVWGTRYRSSALLPKPKAEKILFEFDVLRGTISSRNPWGLYISTLKERSYE